MGAPAHGLVPQRAIQMFGRNDPPERGGIAYPGGERVAFCQLAAFQAADAAFHIGGAAAQHGRGGNAAAHSQVTAQTRRNHADFQCTACLRQQRRVIGHGYAVQRSRAFRPGQRKDGVRLKSQCRAAQGGFQHRRARVIADQSVGKVVGVAVCRAAAAVALRCIPHPARVLHSGQGDGVQYCDAHTVPSLAAKATNSAAVMGVKRILSPAA